MLNLYLEAYWEWSLQVILFELHLLMLISYTVSRHFNIFPLEIDATFWGFSKSYTMKQIYVSACMLLLIDQLSLFSSKSIQSLTQAVIVSAQGHSKWTLKSTPSVPNYWHFQQKCLSQIWWPISQLFKFRFFLKI